MTHYQYDYSALAEPLKSKKAILDIKEYLGDEKFDTVHNQLVQLYALNPFKVERLEMMLMLTGISGFPVLAWFNLIQDDATKIN